MAESMSAAESGEQGGEESEDERVLGPVGGVGYCREEIFE